MHQLFIQLLAECFEEVHVVLSNVLRNLPKLDNLEVQKSGASQQQLQAGASEVAYKFGEATDNAN